jgi:TnpA family transposase
MGIGLNEVAKVCKELGWKGCLSESTIRRTVISMILSDMFTEEQLRKIVENTYSDIIRLVAEMKLNKASNSEIIIELAKRL